MDIGMAETDSEVLVGSGVQSTADNCGLTMAVRHDVL